MASIDTSKDLLERIERAFESLALVLKNKGVAECEELNAQEAQTEDALAWQKLRELTAEGRICEAENYLFDCLEAGPTPLKLKVARMFYQEINQLSDEQLSQHGFSRQEILDGMWDAEHLFMQGEDAVG